MSITWGGLDREEGIEEYLISLIGEEIIIPPSFAFVRMSYAKRIDGELIEIFITNQSGTYFMNVFFNGSGLTLYEALDKFSIINTKSARNI